MLGFMKALFQGETYRLSLTTILPMTQLASKGIDMSPLNVTLFTLCKTKHAVKLYFGTNKNASSIAGQPEQARCQ